MILERIAISGLRNINYLEICANPSINWIAGVNGAGKTSILEAIYLLSRGRGYRGRKHGSMLGSGREFLEVSASVHFTEDDGPLTRLKMIQSHDGSRFQENGQSVLGIQALRRPLHVRLVPENCQQLLEGPPGLRRLFIDWNLFHVEPTYGRLLAEFKRVLGQRNAWLRSGVHGLPIWDAEYCRLAEAISTLRRRYLEGLHTAFRNSLLEKELGACPTIEFHSGWPSNCSLQELLLENLKEDRNRGFTYYGPPRADFVVRNHERKSLPSRGQIKSLVILLQYAAQRHWLNTGGPPSIWLLDDLGAELDLCAMASILRALSALPGQIFITAVASLGEIPKGYAGGPVFHVEQGAIVGMA